MFNVKHWPKRKEILIQLKNDSYDLFRLTFSGGIPEENCNATHLCSEPGHVTISFKKNKSDNFTYFLKTRDGSKFPYNTLTNHTRSTQGTLIVRKKNKNSIKLTSLCFFPLHRRNINMEVNDTEIIIIITDLYIGNKKTVWNYVDNTMIKPGKFKQNMVLTF